jgi:hypothetical protein
MTRTFHPTRLGALALAAAGVLFVIYPAVRPWRDESTTGGALAAMSSGGWVASHLSGMLGFILLSLGLLALRDALARTPAAGPTEAAPPPAGRSATGPAAAAVLTGWLGAGLILPYYGAETFGLHGIAGEAAAGQSLPLLDLVDAVRFDPVAVTMFGTGLLLLAAAGVLAAVAVWRSDLRPRGAGVVLAAGLALYLPQFYAPPAVRIGHGVLVAVGAFWLAAVLWRARRPG